MRILMLIVLMMAPPAIAKDGFTTAPEYAEDFEASIPCGDLNGRKVWKGSRGYYWQAEAFRDSGIPDPESANPVPISMNDKATLDMFEAVCK